MKVIKPVCGNDSAKCPKCGDVFEYPLSEEDLMFDEYKRFKSFCGVYWYTKYHTCKEQSLLERFNKGKVTK